MHFQKIRADEPFENLNSELRSVFVVAAVGVASQEGRLLNSRLGITFGEKMNSITKNFGRKRKKKRREETFYY